MPTPSPTDVTDFVAWLQTHGYRLCLDMEHPLECTDKYPGVERVIWFADRRTPEEWAALSGVATLEDFVAWCATAQVTRKPTGKRSIYSNSLPRAIAICTFAGRGRVQTGRKYMQPFALNSPQQMLYRPDRRAPAEWREDYEGATRC